jgi:hypothetical protein
MNLASRCREAISHVAMLKKELAMHQRRNAEALALQRQQTQRMASSLSRERSRLSESFSSEDKDDDESRPASRQEMGKVLSALSPPPPPPRLSNNPIQPHVQQQPETKPELLKLDLPSPPPPPPGGPSNQIKSFSEDSTTPFSNASPQGELFLSEDDEDEERVTPKSKVSAEREDQLRPLSSPSEDKQHRLSDPRTPDSRDSNEEDDDDEGEDEDPKSMTLFPQSASPQKSKLPMSFNEEFPSDIVQPLPRGSSGHRFGNKLPQGLSEQDEEASFASAATTNSKDSARASSSTSPTVTSVNSSGRRRNGPTSMSSIDAFEASFDNAFPDAFSPREQEAPKSTPTSSEIYNPFFPSPTKPQLSNGFANSAGSPHKRPLSRESHLANGFANSAGSPVRGHSRSLSKEAPLPAQPKTPDEKMRPDPSLQFDEYSTPSKAKPDVQLSPVDEPKRPEKTISAVARARYEKAMQPRNGTASREPPVSLSVDTGATSPSETSSATSDSPSLLQRIHQRRMKKKMERQPSAPAAIERYSQDYVAQQNDHLGHRQQSPPESTTRQSPDSFGSEGRHNQFSTQQPRKSAPEASLPSFQESFADSVHREMAVRSSSIRSDKPFDEIEEDPFVAPPKRGPEQRNSLPNGVRGGQNMLPPNSMNREVKSLDAMVGYEHHEQVQLAVRPAELDGMKQPRRNVKQPVSYAEPALNTKLRQGDMYFSKAGNGGHSIVTPEPSAPQNPLVM